MSNNEEDIINQEGYFSLGGNLLTTILTGNSLYLIYFSPHIYKQLLEIDSNLPENYIYIFFGLVITFSNLSNLFSNYFLYGINIRLIILITYIFLLSAHSLIYYTSYLPFIITAFVIYGIGNGISYYPLLLNSCRFFPLYKNIIILLNLFVYSLSPLFFHYISNKIILNNSEIGVKKTLKLEIILYLIIGTLSFIFTFDSFEILLKNKNGLNEKIMLSGEIPIGNLERVNTLNNEEESSTGDSKRNSLVSGTSVNTQNTNIHNLISRNVISNEEDKIRKFSKNLKNVLKSKNFIFINLYYFLTLFGTFGLLFEIKKNISMYLLMISLFRFLSPFIANIFSGKFLSGCSLFFQFGILYVAINSVNYTQNQINLITLISGICYGINSTIISSIIPKIYGYDLSYYLSGIIIVSASFSYWLVFIFKFYFQVFQKNILFLYQISTLLAFVFLFLINETAFDFKLRDEINDVELQNENQRNFDAYSINDVKSERDI